jgi:ATP-binding protein involved in chromosome partitioning
MPKLFGLNSKPSIAPDGKRLIPLESFGVKVMSIGFLIDEGAVVLAGPMVVSALNQLCARSVGDSSYRDMSGHR